MKDTTGDDSEFGVVDAAGSLTVGSFSACLNSTFKGWQCPVPVSGVAKEGKRQRCSGPQSESVIQTIDEDAVTDS